MKKLKSMSTAFDFARIAIDNVPHESSKPTLEELISHVEMTPAFHKTREWKDCVENYVFERPELCKTLYNLQTQDEWQKKSPIRAAGELSSVATRELQNPLNLGIKGENGKEIKVTEGDIKDICENLYNEPERFFTSPPPTPEEIQTTTTQYAIMNTYIRQHQELVDFFYDFLVCQKPDDLKNRNHQLISDYLGVAFNDITRRGADTWEKCGIKGTEKEV